MLLHEDRLFPSEPGALKIARSLYAGIRNLPIVSPHGHTQAAWFAENKPFSDPATLLVQPDHYVFRMLYSQGVSMDDLEIGQPVVKDPRRVWRIFASHYYLFRGTPTRMWLDYAFQELFGMRERLSEKTADLYFDRIAEKLKTKEFLPRALYERFNIEVLSTTESPLDPAGIAPGHSRFGLEGAHCSRIPAGSGSRSRVQGICRIDCPTGRAKRRGYRDVEGLPERAEEGAGAVQDARLHLDRPRAPHGANCGPA